MNLEIEIMVLVKHANYIQLQITYVDLSKSKQRRKETAIVFCISCLIIHEKLQNFRLITPTFCYALKDIYALLGYKLNVHPITFYVIEKIQLWN